MLMVLSDVLTDVCKTIHERSGRPVSTKLKAALADRIALYALDGETDPTRLKVIALAGVQPQRIGDLPQRLNLEAR